MELRPYQLEAIQSLRNAVTTTNRRLLLQAPTGAGKTVIAAEIIRSARAKGSVIWFVAHRRELVQQTSEKLNAIGVSHGIVMQGYYEDEYEAVYVGTIQSLSARLSSGRLVAPNPNLIIIDEAHRSMARTYLELTQRFPKAVLLGMTATPVRGDGQGLGNLYQTLVQTPTISQLTEAGYLVPVRYFAPSRPDLSGVSIVGGDYNEAELEPIMNTKALVGDVVEWWGRLANGVPTIVFANSVAHSIALAEAYERCGVRVAHLDGETPLNERAAVVRATRRREIDVITNCQLATEGWDFPHIEAVVLARPTKSTGLYLQMAGRALRPSEGKKSCLLIDHAGCYYEHGPITDWEEWQLDTKKGGAFKTRPYQKKEPKPCPECSAIMQKGVCPECGYKHEKWGRDVETIDGELVEMANGKKRRVKNTLADKEAFYAQALAYAFMKGYKNGWVAHKYKARFGVWPVGMKNVQPTYPSIEFKRWLGIQQKFSRPRQESFGLPLEPVVGKAVGTREAFYTVGGAE